MIHFPTRWELRAFTQFEILFTFHCMPFISPQLCAGLRHENIPHKNGSMTSKVWNSQLPSLRPPSPRRRLPPLCPRGPTGRAVPSGVPAGGPGPLRRPPRPQPVRTRPTGPKPHRSVTGPPPSLSRGPTQRRGNRHRRHIPHNQPIASFPDLQDFSAEAGGRGFHRMPGGPHR